jgi:hypothetical protein
MTLTVIPPQKYIYSGLYKIYWLPAVATISAPSRAEINAGLDLTPALSKISGFSVANQITEIAPVGSAWVEQRPGTNKSSASNALMLYDDKVSMVMRDTWLIPGYPGYVLLAPYGDAGGRHCDVWPVFIASASQTWEQIAMYLVTFAARSFPAIRGVLPA